MERLLAYAQIGLALFWGIVFASMLFILVFFGDSIPEGVAELLHLLLAQLVAIALLTVQYFFSRQRPPTPTDRPTDRPTETPPPESG